MKRGRPKGTKNKWNSRWYIPLGERFWEKVDKKSDDECWEWQAFIHPSGYGMFAINRKMTLAHRVAWEITNGIIPKDKIVCHKCDNRICVNPNHLFIGDYKDNSQDRDIKLRGKIPDNKGEKHGMSKLSENEVREIIKLSKSGIPQKEIANKFGVVRQTVNDIVNRKAWRHIK